MPRKRLRPNYWLFFPLITFPVASTGTAFPTALKIGRDPGTALVWFRKVVTGRPHMLKAPRACGYAYGTQQIVFGPLTLIHLLPSFIQSLLRNEQMQLGFIHKYNGLPPQPCRPADLAAGAFCSMMR